MQVIWEEKEEKSEFIVIFEVIHDSLAASSGVQVVCCYSSSFP